MTDLGGHTLGSRDVWNQFQGATTRSSRDWSWLRDLGMGLGRLGVDAYGAHQASRTQRHVGRRNVEPSQMTNPGPAIPSPDRSWQDWLRYGLQGKQNSAGLNPPKTAASSAPSWMPMALLGLAAVAVLK